MASTSQSSASAQKPTTAASVVVVGCGCPGRSMGWYHAYQLLYQEAACPSATLKYVVEPWYMSSTGKNSPGSDVFDAWRKELETTRGVQFFETVREVPQVNSNNGSGSSSSSSGERRLAIISARTSDNPKLFADCLAIGCHSIYLEKPGAPTVVELEAMKKAADAAKTTVLMGFNKNVAKYSTKTREFAAAKSDNDANLVTFVHNNSYSKDSLAECFERCSEGMLKNMAIHELALLVTFYGVSTQTIASVEADKEYSSCQTLVGPSSKQNFTDFDKLKFTVTTTSGVKVSVAADRCGGDDSVGIVTNMQSGEELFSYSMPDQEDLENIKVLEKNNPGAMPYFYVQDADYATLKERIAKHCVDGTPAEGVATIEVAIETLKVAEYLTPLLQEQLL